MSRGGSRPGERRGGRRKGTRNKRSTVLLDALAAWGCSLPEALAQALKDPQTSRELRLDLLKLVLPYCYLQLKPVDPDGYLTPEQAAAMLGEQAVQFRDAIQQYVPDPIMVALILDTAYAGSMQSD